MMWFMMKNIFLNSLTIISLYPFLYKKTYDTNNGIQNIIHIFVRHKLWYDGSRRQTGNQ